MPHNTHVPRVVFGVPLEESLDVAQMCNLPAIVFRSIQYLEAKKADQEEGIYRLSGSSAVIKNLKDRFNSGTSGHLGCIWDVTEMATLLPIRIQKETSTCLHQMSIGIPMRLLGS